MGHSIAAGFFQRWLASPARAGAAFLPGVLLASALALLALELASRTILPAVLIGLLLGMATAGFASRPALEPGLAFSSRTLLRIGVALLGARVTMSEMAALGLPAATIAIGGLIVALLLGYALGRALGLSRELACLTAAAVAICGASAALAVAAVLPRRDGGAREAAATIAAITVIGTAAMLAYPLLAVAVGLSETEAGILYGAALHEVVQAVGAGFAHAPLAGEVATTVKLARVACLAPVVMLIGWWSHREGDGATQRPPPLPLFLAGFLAFAGLASLGLLAADVQAMMAEASRFLLLVAIVALGSKIAPRQLRDFGWRPLLAISVQSVLLAAFALAAILFLYR